MAWLTYAPAARMRFAKQRWVAHAGANLHTRLHTT